MDGYCNLSYNKKLVTLSNKKGWFSIEDKGYIGTGNRQQCCFLFLKDFWEYDPGTNAWTQNRLVHLSPRKSHASTRWAFATFPTERWNQAVPEIKARPCAAAGTKPRPHLLK